MKRDLSSTGLWEMSGPVSIVEGSRPLFGANGGVWLSTSVWTVPNGIAVSLQGALHPQSIVIGQRSAKADYPLYL